MPLITRLASTNRSVSDDASASAASTADRPRVPSPPLDIGARLTQTLHRGSSQDSRLLSSITGGATDADQARRSLRAPSRMDRGRSLVRGFGLSWHPARVDRYAWIV